MNTLDALDADSLRSDIPPFRPGDTVKVHVRVVEGNRSRIQVFQGVVIRRQGGGIRETFTVRKVSFGVGVERTFPVHTPVVEKIEVVTRGDVRRAKLYYLRELRGKAVFVPAFFIPSGSMETTLHGCTGCTGDRVLVNKVPYWFGAPRPGDIVVFKGPDTWAPEVTVAPASNWFAGALLWLGREIGVAPPSEDDVHKPVLATPRLTVQRSYA